MDQLVAGLTGNVAADELTVHADTLARNLKHTHMVSCNLLEALLHQVYTACFLIFADTATKQIIGVYRGNHVSQEFQPKGFACQKVELALLEQVFVTTPKALLQNRHPHKNANGGVGTTALLSFGKQRLKYLLVYLRGHEAVELVVPGIRVGILLGGTVAQLHHGSREHVQLRVWVCLLKHRLPF